MLFSRTALTCLWLAIITMGSFLSDSWKARFLVHGVLHLPIHVAVFAVSGLLVFGVQRSPRRRTFGSLGLLGLALLLESIQRAMYPIHFEWRDLMADSAGVVVALFLTANRLSKSETRVRF